MVPGVEKVVLHNACQFKDNVMEYMIEKAVNLKHLHLYAANLVSNDMWSRFIKERAPQLETLKLQWLDATFEDSHVAELAQHCATSLRRLKLELCRRLGATSIQSISQMQALEHLSLSLSPAAEIPVEALVEMVNALGPNLQTLSLERFPNLTDEVLDAIRTYCPRLTKLRLSHNDVCTDAGFAALFSGWSADAAANGDRSTSSKTNTDFRAISPLRFADFSSTREVNSDDGGGNDTNDNDDDPDNPPPSTTIGLGSSGFTALMNHASHSLTHLNLSSCRHISHAALIEAFCFGHDYPNNSNTNDNNNNKRHINITNEDLYASPSPAPESKNNYTYTDSSSTNPKTKNVSRRTYPSLKHIDLSFVPTVDELVLAGIFKSCPALERVVAFGCFGIDAAAAAAAAAGNGNGNSKSMETAGPVVPPGVVLIGVPRAQDAIEQFGIGIGTGMDVAMDGDDGDGRGNGNGNGNGSDLLAMMSSMVDVAA